LEAIFISALELEQEKLLKLPIGPTANGVTNPKWMAYPGGIVPHEMPNPEATYCNEVPVNSAVW